MPNDAIARDVAARARAIGPAESFIVQAPAGSGKTTLLTLRYLRLLADVERPEQIVAITFTRKAAAEMRHRIVAALRLAAAPLADDADERERELHRHASAALARSRERGWGLEHNPARLHVQTIDGLNHWLARRLPLAARIGGSLSVVDDARPLYAEAARRTVARLDGNDAVSAGLERLARAVNHEPRQLAGLVAAMLGARELWLPKLMQTTPGPALRASIDRLLRRALEAELAAVAMAVRDVDWKPLFSACRRALTAGAPPGLVHVLGLLSDLPGPTAEALPAWQALAQLVLTGDKAPALRKSVTARQGFFAGTEGPTWKALKDEVHGCLARLADHPALAESIARLRVLPPADLSDAQWERIDAVAAVLPHAVAELLTLFAERDSLDHPAVAAAARDALGDESAPTELALSLDYRIRHLLVDEYQDTSPSQARLLELLVAGWQPGDGRSLFCVGDPMQSIYAFREADVTLFLQAQHQGIGGVALAAERLGRNFRSGAPLVDWVNATFATLLPGADDFERGAVRYSPAAAANPGEAKDGVFVHALIDADERAMAAEVTAIARVADEEPARPSVAILVRSRPSLPPILAALRAAGVEYRGVELEALLDRPAIRDLVSLLRALLREGDRTAWLSVLRAPWCGLPLADLLELAGDEGSATLRERLLLEDEELPADSAERARRARGVLDEAASTRASHSLGSWLRTAWLALGGPATVDDPSDLANAELLFVALDRLEREAGCCPQVSEIEAAVEGVMASPVGSEAARIQVMTIHRAKGLEFDIVILPDLQRSPRRADRPLLYWTSIATAPGERGIVLAGRADASEEGPGDALERWMRKLDDERDALELGRIAYVAATRARRQLHLLGSARTRDTPDRAALRRPGTGSLLGFLWPVLAPQFEQALDARGPAVPASRERRRRLTAPPAQRLEADWRLPEAAAPALAPALRIVGESGDAIRPEFDWAGAIAQAVGHVVHGELERLSRAGPAPDAGATAERRWRRALAALGIDDSHLSPAVERVARAMKTVAASTRAAALLDPSAREAQSELALTALIDGVAHGIRIDRTFVDAAGTRWIVDWKTSSHEGGDRESFLDRELERYRGQLERYVRALQLLEPQRPVKAGLYFPLLDAWREL
jgi:ATP-dependent exoDNAse (exonuclease V) beta subunit